MQVGAALQRELVQVVALLARAALFLVREQQLDGEAVAERRAAAGALGARSLKSGNRLNDHRRLKFVPVHIRKHVFQRSGSVGAVGLSLEALPW